MGMYTGLRFKGIIKEEYRDDIDTLISTGKWGEWKNQIFIDFGKCDRSCFIPFGALAYMPDEWEDRQEKDERGFTRYKARDGFEIYLNKETGLFCFQCILKNYESTIEYFMENVIPNISDEVIHCEYLYEEDSKSTLYELKDGKLEPLDYGIRYEYYEEPYGKYVDYEDFDFTKENKYR